MLSMRLIFSLLLAASAASAADIEIEWKLGMEVQEMSGHSLRGKTMKFIWSGNHDVANHYDETAWDNCDPLAEGVPTLSAISSSTTANSFEITFGRYEEGVYYFFCSVPGHCQGGQKLKVSVYPGAAEINADFGATAPAAAPTAGSAWTKESYCEELFGAGSHNYERWYDQRQAFASTGGPDMGGFAEGTCGYVLAVWDGDPYADAVYANSQCCCLDYEHMCSAAAPTAAPTRAPTAEGDACADVTYCQYDVLTVCGLSYSWDFSWTYVDEVTMAHYCGEECQAVVHGTCCEEFIADEDATWLLEERKMYQELRDFCHAGPSSECVAAYELFTDGHCNGTTATTMDAFNSTKYCGRDLATGIEVESTCNAELLDVMQKCDGEDLGMFSDGAEDADIMEFLTDAITSCYMSQGCAWSWTRLLQYCFTAEGAPEDVEALCMQKGSIEASAMEEFDVSCADLLDYAVGNCTSTEGYAGLAEAPARETVKYMKDDTCPGVVAAATSACMPPYTSYKDGHCNGTTATTMNRFNNTLYCGKSVSTGEEVETTCDEELATVLVLCQGVDLGTDGQGEDVYESLVMDFDKCHMSQGCAWPYLSITEWCFADPDTPNAPALCMEGPVIDSPEAAGATCFDLLNWSVGNCTGEGDELRAAGEAEPKRLVNGMKSGMCPTVIAAAAPTEAAPTEAAPTEAAPTEAAVVSDLAPTAAPPAADDSAAVARFPLLALLVVALVAACY